MSKCIILSRVSTTDQSLDSQTQVIKNEAIKNGFSLDQMIIIEDKESGIRLSEEERHGLNEMKRYIESDNEITHVFIYELSRLSRRQLVLFSIRDYLIERKIQLVCCTPYFKLLEDNKLSQTASLMFSIFASMAESEMALKQERMMRGKRHNKAHGKNSGHGLLYGYAEKEDKTIVVDPKKAKEIVEIFIEYSTGKYSLDTLSEHFKKKHTIDEHRLYERARLAFILGNESYCGNTEYPQIIEKQLFERCREIRSKNNTCSKKTKESQALCKRILFDEHGNHMTFIMYGGDRYLSVKNSNPTVKRECIDDNVWMLAKILHKSYIDNKDKIRKKLEADVRSLNERIEILVKNKKRIAANIDAIEERLIYGKLSKSKAQQLEQKAEEAMKKTDEEHAKLSNEIISLEKQIEQTYEQNGLDYESLSYEQKVELIRQVIDRIIVRKPKKREAELEVIPKFGKSKYVIRVNVYTNESSMKILFL